MESGTTRRERIYIFYESKNAVQIRSQKTGNKLNYN